MFENDFTPEEIAPHLFSADMDRPLPMCYCASCRSEGLYPITTDCLFYRKVEWD